MTVFWGCVKTTNDLKNHPFSQTKSRSQVSGSDIYSDFQRSVLLGKVFFARLPDIFIHPFEVHEHLFHKAVIDRIVLREMMAAVFCGKRIKINGLPVIDLNHGTVIHKS